MKRLCRTWYPTDAGPDNAGSFSTHVPDVVIDRIVSVDWSVPGEVEVTYWDFA